MKLRNLPLLLVVLLLILLGPASAKAQQAQAVVRAVLFYSPSCGHCHYVMSETLPPLVEKYGEQLQILGVDVSQPDGQSLFMAALQKFGLESGGVPFLVVDNLYLVGSLDIPEKFPGLVETYISQGGVGWPDIPGLIDLLPAEIMPPAASSSGESAALPATAAPETVSPSSVSPEDIPGIVPAESGRPNWLVRFSQDPYGNTMSVVVLVGMIAALVWIVADFPKTHGPSVKNRSAWIIPILCAVGLGVAGYLAFVETTQATAVCGPVGDCNTVQQSEYARLFGILPIGVLGLIGYIAIFVAWLVARYGDDRFANLAIMSLFAMTVFGTLFSIYLTFLEPFVIGATCAWCLTSAVLITILMLFSAGIAKRTLIKNPFRSSPPRRRKRVGVRHD